MHEFSVEAAFGLQGAAIARVPVADLGAEELPGWDLLHAEEQAWALGRSERRKREVVAGRAALRSALRAVGWSGDKALLASPQGRPEVPAGFTGSITHKDGEALAVGAVSTDGRTLGIDSEVVGRDRSSIASRVLRAVERERWEAGGSRWTELLELFSLKEAIYKALHPHVPRYIAFSEAEVDADGAIRMHLERGEGPFELRGFSKWEDQRLVSLVEAWPRSSGA